MNSKINNQDGFETLSLLAVVVVIGIIVFAGLSISKNRSKNTSSNSSNSTIQESSIKNKSDITNAKKDINELPVDKDLDPAQFDADISDLN